jgi:hypothetical protein
MILLFLKFILISYLLALRLSTLLISSFDIRDNACVVSFISLIESTIWFSHFYYANKARLSPFSCWVRSNIEPIFNLCPTV